jgi:hypothetical protein
MQAIDDSGLIGEAGSLVGHKFTVASSRYEIDELWEHQGELWFRATSDFDQLSMTVSEGLDYGLLSERVVPARLRRRTPDILLTGRGRRER